MDPEDSIVSSPLLKADLLLMHEPDASLLWGRNCSILGTNPAGLQKGPSRTSAIAGPRSYFGHCHSPFRLLSAYFFLNTTISYLKMVTSCHQETSNSCH